jgi:hypothetical protein
MRIDPLAYEGYILTMKGTLTGWVVEWYRERSPGVIPMPTYGLNYMDVPDIKPPPEAEGPPAEGAPETPDPDAAAQKARDAATGG